jgi:Mrp family chromosome partitioning ATPase
MLLPAGRADPDPLSGLTSPRMLRLLQDAAEQFDWVVIDTPPLGATTDAGLLAPMVDAAILVIRAGVTAHAAIQSAIDTLGRDRIVGVVLNAASPEETAGYDLDYTHYSDTSEKR